MLVLEIISREIFQEGEYRESPTIPQDPHVRFQCFHVTYKTWVVVCKATSEDDVVNDVRDGLINQRCGVIWLSRIILQDLIGTEKQSFTHYYDQNGTPVNAICMHIMYVYTYEYFSWKIRRFSWIVREILNNQREIYRRLYIYIYDILFLQYTNFKTYQHLKPMRHDFAYLGRMTHIIFAPVKQIITD